MSSQSPGSQPPGSQLCSSNVKTLNRLQGTGATTQLLQGTSTVTLPGRSAAQVEKGSGGPFGGTTRLVDDSTALAFAASVLEPEPASGMGRLPEPEPAGEPGFSHHLACMAGGPHAAASGTRTRISGTALVQVAGRSFSCLNHNGICCRPNPTQCYSCLVPLATQVNRPLLQFSGH